MMTEDENFNLSKRHDSGTFIRDQEFLKKITKD